MNASRCALCSMHLCKSLAYFLKLESCTSLLVWVELGCRCRIVLLHTGKISFKIEAQRSITQCFPLKFEYVCRTWPTITTQFMKNISKSLGYPILDDVIILMAKGQGKLKVFLKYSYSKQAISWPLGYGEILQISLVIWLVVILAYFAIPYSLTSFSFLTHTQSIS